MTSPVAVLLIVKYLESYSHVVYRLKNSWGFPLFHAEGALLSPLFGYPIGADKSMIRESL
jgi:hypothetical protein